MNRKVVRKLKLGEESPKDDLAHWLSRPPEERIEAVEMLRRQFYGSVSRLEGIVRIIKQPKG